MGRFNAITTVLVTGASGFIGRPLVATLARAGHRVVAASRHPLATPDGAVRAIPLQDLAGSVDWSALLTDVTHVVHLAAVAHQGAAVPDEIYERVNRRAVAELAAVAALKGVRRLIFVSSIGSQSGPICERVLTERDEPRPTSVYGRAKLAAEADVRAAGVPYTIFRPVLTYGPQAKGNMARLLKLAESPFWLPFGAFRHRRSLVAVDNLIAAIAFALVEPKTAGETFIVSDADALSLPEILTEMRRAMKRAPGLVPVPPALVSTTLRLIGYSDMCERLAGSLIASPAKLVAAGWRPPLNTREGLGRMVGSGIRSDRAPE
ncbi:MAG TPA: NAD-dependent epimerase/dehydratase family protein [Xanthobacteraceae bacterium]|nr:NAD-dependent epimerase/dehydratase family protein [Xanthobacteraceae bacterium]